jgi:sugar lactone lactonase YvrE
LNSDGTTTKVLDNQTISNGLDFTPDGAGAILVDSPTQEIRRYRLPEGDEPWSVFETIATISPQDGIPDGICLDAEGGVWVALWGGSRVHRYSMSGQLTDVIDLPASQVTACALGGVDGCTLFISTSRLGLSSDPEPHDGAIFMSRVKIPGSPLALARG